MGGMSSNCCCCGRRLAPWKLCCCGCCWVGPCPKQRTNNMGILWSTGKSQSLETAASSSDRSRAAGVARREVDRKQMSSTVQAPPFLFGTVDLSDDEHVVAARSADADAMEMDSNAGNNGGEDVDWKQVSANLDAHNLRLKQEVKELKNSLNAQKEEHGLEVFEMNKRHEGHKESAQRIQWDLQNERDKWQGSSDHWHNKCQHLEAEIRKHVSQLNRQVARIEDLDSTCDDLRRQLLAVESQRGKEAGASGLYVDSAATPSNLGKAAEGVYTSVQSLSRPLFKFTNANWKSGVCSRLLNDSSIKLNRTTDVRFWLQAEIVRVAFGHLWNPDRYFSFNCLPVLSNISLVQQHHFTRYQMLLAGADKIPTQLTKSKGRFSTTSTVQSTSEICNETCKAEQMCSCGAVEFEQFCHKNVADLEKMDFWEFVPEDKVVDIHEMFIGFLLNVWLVYQLSLAFEQPACLFEVIPNVDSKFHSSSFAKLNSHAVSIKHMIETSIVFGHRHAYFCGHRLE